MKSVAIIEDDAELRVLLKKYINNQSEYSTTIVVDSIEDFLKELQSGIEPNIIISDIGLPGIQGDEALELLKQKSPSSEVVMLTVHGDTDKIFKCLRNGASGYILKNAPLEEIKQHLDILGNGGAPMSPQIARQVIEYFQPTKKLESPLTEREYEIVNALVEGLSYKMIGEKLNIALDTVRQHIRNVYRKLNVNSKAEVIKKKLRGEI